MPGDVVFVDSSNQSDALEVGCRLKRNLNARNLFEDDPDLFASIAPGLKVPKAKRKEDIDQRHLTSRYITLKHRPGYFLRLNNMLAQVLKEQSALAYSLESKIIDDDFLEIKKLFGGKYAGLALLQCLIPKLNISGFEYQILPYFGVMPDLYNKMESNFLELGLVNGTSRYISQLCEFSEEYTQAFGKMVGDLSVHFSDVVKQPYDINVRTSCNFEYGGIPGILDSIVSLGAENHSKLEKAIMLLNFYLQSYTYKFYEKIIPDGVTFSPLIQQAIFPEKSAFVFSSLPGFSSSGTVVESVLGHASRIANGGDSVYVRIKNGIVQEVVNSFKELPFQFTVNGKEFPDYPTALAFVDAQKGKDWYEEREKYNEGRREVWNSATHEINGNRSPLSIEELSLLETLAKKAEDTLGYPVKIEISKIGNTWYPLQIDPLTIKTDSSIDVTVPEGSISVMQTPFVNMPFKVEGKLVYGPSSEIGSIDEDFIYFGRYDLNGNIIRVNIDEIIHYSPNVKAIYSPETGSKTCHTAGGIFELLGFMGSSKGLGKLRGTLQEKGNLRMTPYNIVLASNGEKGVVYIPKEQVSTYEASRAKPESHDS
jgi:hypothetical protein